MSPLSPIGNKRMLPMAREMLFAEAAELAASTRYVSESLRPHLKRCVADKSDIRDSGQ